MSPFNTLANLAPGVVIQRGVRPPAPPVYRPAATSAAANRQAAAVQRIDRRPAPPAYQPQAKPVTLQRQPLQRQSSAGQTTGRHPAPLVYRPPAAAPTLQRRPTFTKSSEGHSAPQVYRPATMLPAGPIKAVAVQPFFEIPAARIFSSDSQISKKNTKPAAVIGGERNFSSQVKISGSFLEEGTNERVNVSVRQKVDLRVSGDGEMAIEDSNLLVRQPKTFYASAAVLAHSRQRLQLAGSGIKLVSTGKDLRIRLDQTRVKDLKQVVPGNRGDSYLNYQAPQNCQNMASFVTGMGADSHMTTPSAQALRGQLDATVQGEIQKAIAEYVARRLGTSTAQASRFRDATLGPMEMDGPEDVLRKKQAVEAIARDYVNALQGMNAADVDRELRSLGINQFARASVGEAYVTHTIAEDDDRGRITDYATSKKFVPKWSYHFAAVVAQSGNDRVTMENYARGGEVVGNVGLDPRWYFQMYGAGEEQSFHEASLASGGFANAMTMVLRRPPPPVPAPIAAPVRAPSLLESIAGFASWLLS